LRAKVAAAQVQKLQQPSPEISFTFASKQGGGTERYLIFWSLLLTTQIGFHLLICNVSLFVFFFSLEVETRGFSLLMGEMGFLGLVGARQHS